MVASLEVTSILKWCHFSIQVTVTSASDEQMVEANNELGTQFIKNKLIHKDTLNGAENDVIAIDIIKIR